MPRSLCFVLSRLGTTDQWCDLMWDPMGSSQLPVDSGGLVEVGRPWRRPLPQSSLEEGWCWTRRGWWMLDTIQKQSQEASADGVDVE